MVRAGVQMATADAAELTLARVRVEIWAVQQEVQLAREKATSAEVLAKVLEAQLDFLALQLAASAAESTRLRRENAALQAVRTRPPTNRSASIGICLNHRPIAVPQ
eukprot:252890-Pyramimonas_sp.AAC.3